MTRKLLVTIALGVALAIVAAGTATSQVSVGDLQVTVPSTSVPSTSVPSTSVPSTTGVLPQCSDLSDNDGDGLVDTGDPGCSGALDSSEYNESTSSGGSTTTGGSGGSTTTGSSGSSTYGSGSGGSGGSGGGGAVKGGGAGGKKGAGARGLFGKQA